MSESRTTLAAEIAAELETTLFDAAQGLASKLRRSQQFQRLLRLYGLIRPFQLPEHETNTLDITGVEAAYSTLPAFGSLLYGISIHAHRLKMAHRTIVDASEEVRVHVGDLDFYEYLKRLRWKRIQHMYELLGEVIMAPNPPQLILVSLPLLVAREEAGNREQVEPVQEEWEAMLQAINGFWTQHLDRLFPFNPTGIWVASLQSSSAWPLFVALRNNPHTSPDKISSELTAYIESEWVGLRQAGMSRLLHHLLPPQTRTIAYSAEDLGLDPRWQPKALQHSGILEFSLRSRPGSPIWLVQIAGHRTQWNSATLDQLAAIITQATITEGEEAMPLPLWYAEQLAVFPPAMLTLFRELAREQIDRGQLESQHHSTSALAEDEGREQ